MPPYEHVEHDAVSDVGRKRKNNEDAWLSLPQHGVFCVADGMGGADEGEVASGAIVDALDGAFRGLDTVVLSLDSKVRMVRKALDSASAWILARSRSRGSSGSGSTFVGLVLDAAQPGQAAALHVGDSRLYRCRGGSLKSITRDHSVAALEGLANEDDLAPMFRSMITRAVGMSETVKLERTDFDVAAGDRLFLCSDGLTRMVPDDVLGKILTAMPDASAKAQAQRLVDAANAAGGKDNVTVSFLRIGPLPAPVAAVQAGAEGDERETADEAGGAPGSGRDRPSEEKITPPSGLPPDAGDVLVGRTPSSGHELDLDAAARAPAAPRGNRWPIRVAVGVGGVAILALAAAGLLRVLPGRQGGEGQGGTCRILVDSALPGAGERMTVSIRDQGATEWTVVGRETVVKRGAIDVRWERTDYEPLQSAVRLEAETLTLAPPGEWRPAPALAKLFELEAHAQAGRWQPVDEFLSGQGSAGVLEGPSHRERWAALRAAWQKRRAVAPPPAVAVTPSAATSPAPRVPPPVAVATAAAAVVAAPVTPSIPAVDLRPPSPPPPPAAPVRVVFPRAAAGDGAPVSVSYRTAAGAVWVPAVMGGSTNLPAGPLEVRFERDGYADVLVSATLRDEAVEVVAPAPGQWRINLAKLGGAAAAEKAYADAVRRLQSRLGLAEGAAGLAAAPAGGSDAETLASLRARIEDWRAQCAGRGLEDVAALAGRTCAAASSPASRAAWSNYWGFTMQDAAAGEFVAALASAPCEDLARGATSAKAALERAAGALRTPAEWDRLVPEPGLAPGVAACAQPWLLVARHASALRQALQLLGADSLTAIHRDRLPAECDEVERRLAQVQRIEAALRAAPGGGPALTAWLLHGGCAQIETLAQDVDNLKRSVDALKAAVTARRQRH